MFTRITLVLSLIFYFIYFLPGQCQSEIYPVPEGIAGSSIYKVYVNKQSVFVYDTPVAPEASFELKGPVEIEIKADRDVRWVDIRPKIEAIEPSFKDSTIRFRLSKPCKLSIELNGEPGNKPLFLFANPPEENKLLKNEKGITYFEGGKVYYPGHITLQSNEKIYIEGGAIVYGYITAEDASNIFIGGRGILEGSRNAEFMGKDYSQFIHLKNCRNVDIEGITLVNSPTWQVVPIHSENINIRNIKIISNNGGDDGMDLVRSKKIKISDCFVHTKDDCIAIKSAWDYPGSQGNEDITVSRSVFWNTEWGNALEIGFELCADTMKNISFRDCDVIHCDDGAVFSIHNADRSVVKDILFENIRVEDAHQKLFDLAIFLSQYSADRPADPMERKARYQNGPWDGTLHLSPAEKKQHAPYRGQIRNVFFRNITVTDGIFPFSLFIGYDDSHTVENIVIDNLVVHGKKIQNEKEARITKEYCKGLVIR